MLMNLAELAAYVRDVKPESDVHSNHPKSCKFDQLWELPLSSIYFSS